MPADELTHNIDPEDFTFTMEGTDLLASKVFVMDWTNTAVVRIEIRETPDIENFKIKVQYFGHDEGIWYDFYRIKNILPHVAIHQNNVSGGNTGFNMALVGS